MLFFYSHQKNPEKLYDGFQKKHLNNTTVFNIDNNKKCFFSSESVY